MPRGRLLKKAEQEKFETLQVERYPWQDFSPESILLPDNPRKSVVLSKTHTQTELRQKVQKPPEFSRTFGHPTKPIIPQDMTAEFLASQEELRMRKRRMQMDEDELVALELLDLNEAEQQDEQQQVQAVKTSDTAEDPTGLASAGAAAKASAQSRSPSPDISDLSSLTPTKNKGLGGRGLDFGLNDFTQDKMDAEIQAAFERGMAQGRLEGEESGFQRGLSQATAETQAHDAGIPKTESGIESLSAEIAEAKYAEGLHAGIEQGREEAVKEADEKYKHSMALFAKALSELQHLKGELLSTGREIFAEIAQMCAERILRQQVKWNDEALRRVFTVAMQQFQAQDELKIEMHPEDVARLEQQIPENERARIRLVGNAKLERGDIKIEANNEVVSFDIEKTVASVIDSLKDELFEEVKTDGTDEKAG
jgi:flagellar biosynthesis/type III secretory pathway protein FliH